MPSTRRIELALDHHLLKLRHVFVGKSAGLGTLVAELGQRRADGLNRTNRQNWLDRLHRPDGTDRLNWLYGLDRLHRTHWPNRLHRYHWLDRLDRVRFWCAFRITRAGDERLIVECRQTLAIVEMPSSKLQRLPEHWDKYRG